MCIRDRYRCVEEAAGCVRLAGWRSLCHSPQRRGPGPAHRQALPAWADAVAVEATGGFETVVAASLGAAGLPVIVVNPAQVRAFATAVGKRAKTDPLDA